MDNPCNAFPVNSSRYHTWRRRKAMEEARATLPARMAAARCRVLTGAEFAARKAELEQRERDERERRELWA